MKRKAFTMRLIVSVEFISRSEMTTVLTRHTASSRRLKPVRINKTSKRPLVQAKKIVSVFHSW